MTFAAIKNVNQFTSPWNCNALLQLMYLLVNSMLSSDTLTLKKYPIYVTIFQVTAF